MARKSKVVVARYEAVGGPPESGTDQAGNPYGPTGKGQYVVAYCGKHTSPNLYRFWSGIPWGARLRLRNENVEVFLDGRWQPTTNFTPATREDIMSRHTICITNTSFPTSGSLMILVTKPAIFSKMSTRNSALTKKSIYIASSFILRQQTKRKQQKVNMCCLNTLTDAFT